MDCPHALKRKLLRTRRFAWAVNGTYGLDMHNVNFLDLPMCRYLRRAMAGTNEPTAFSSTNAWNPAFGIVMDYLVDDRLSVGLRGIMLRRMFDWLREPKLSGGRDDGTFAIAVSEYTIDDTVKTIGVEPMVSYNVWEGLSVHVGVRLSFVNSAKYYQIGNLVGTKRW